MKYLINKNIKNVIKESLNLEESFAAQPKSFSIITDYLSDASVNNHIELYKDYVEKFNSTSMKLDSVDRSSAGPNNSDYRSLKIDETFNFN